MTTPSSTSASTSASTLTPLLPLNLYHLSPTIQKWCALRCADIATLNTRGVYYENKSIHHYLNHPIRYIKLIGLIVSIDDFARRRIYTIDDSSGVCLECVALLPPPPPSNPSSSTTSTSTSKTNLPTTQTPAPSEPSITQPQIPWDTISECKTVRILGVMGTYMSMPQLQIVKMGVVESTDVERKWWDECAGLKDPSLGILGRDWVLNEEEIERWKRRERRRKAREVERGRQGVREGQGQGKKMIGNREGNRLKDGGGRKQNTDSVKEERAKQQQERKRKDDPHHLLSTIPVKPPRETSPNKINPKSPTTEKRILPIALSDLSKYDTFGL
ncbi:1337e072-ea7f-4fda-bc0e-df9aef1f9f96 [Sclerotinia trifoliorum]|uniref:1337e072-ea7f-4fda-bc0e-df9aef1f9f96 n=1 Tax=Sclerotinia trifoliorum TaxID=28548 RepID=A0A8H2VLJ6_9HELO|nr:1337e072-ea7f-4fda-bc0e-df9aef1f9f96 [Sclerotinia trifoliorum]